MAHRSTTSHARTSLPPLIPYVLERLRSEESHATPFTAQLVHDLYYLSPSQRLTLDPNDHSALIALFGTLSLPINISTLHRSDLASRMLHETSTPWWEFVLILVRDKRESNSLSASDLYWLVVARLRIQGHSQVVVDPHPGDDIREARQRFIGVSIRDFEGKNHEAYITFLFSSRRGDGVQEACGWLQAMLTRSRVVRPSLQALFWRAVLHETVISSDAHKAALLSIITHRLFTQRWESSETSHDLPKHSAPASAIDLILHTAHYILPQDDCIDGLSPSQAIVKDWSAYLARTLFATELPLETRWRHLTWLAVASYPDAPIYAVLPSLRAQSQSHLHPVDMRLLLSLAILERFGKQGKLTTMFQPVIHQSWNAWSSSILTDNAVHATLVRPILASFFTLAAHTRDATFLDQVVRFTGRNSWIWAFSFGDDHARTQVQSLAVDYICAATLRGQTIWEEILREIPNYASFRQWQPMLIGQALARIAHIDPDVAFERFSVWRTSLDIPRECVTSLCQTFAEAGKIDFSIPLLKKCDWTTLQAQHALMAILEAMRRSRMVLDDVPLLDELGKHLLTAVALPQPLHKSNRLRVFWILSALNRKGKSKLAFDIMNFIRQSDPRYFRYYHVDPFVRQLLHHQQLPIAFSYIEQFCTSFSRRVISSWARMAIVAADRVGSDLLAIRARALILEPKVSRDPYARLLSDQRSTKRIRLRLFKLAHLSARAVSPRTPAFIPAIRKLLQMRGPRAVVRLVRRVGDDLQDRHRTAIGNMMLDFWLKRKRYRPLVRTFEDLADTLQKLQARLGFKPNRVTFNIAINRLLRKPLLDVPRTQALFNLVVQVGYPVPSPYSAGRPFFEGVEVENPLLLEPVWSAVSGQKISFKRHVWPLYRQFQWAFYEKGDPRSARAIVGILKALAKEDARRRTERHSQQRNG